jgi:hypothetical protein
MRMDVASFFCFFCFLLVYRRGFIEVDGEFELSKVVTKDVRRAVHCLVVHPWFVLLKNGEQKEFLDGDVNESCSA